jgi:aminotransferase
MSTSVSKSAREFLASTLATIPRSGIRDFFDIVSTMDDVISLGVGEPVFDTPWHIREASVFALERGATSYTSNLGLLKLRQAIAGYVAETFGVSYNPEKEVLVTVGVSEALDLAVRALVNPGDEVLYHEPCYVSYAPVVTLAHGVPVPVQTTSDTGFRLTRALLEEKVSPRTKVLMLNFPNNPTGGTLDPDDVAGIAGFAQDHDLIVITDEIYSELTYEGRHVSIASLPGMRERTILLHGFSKAWAMTGFRAGYSCAPETFTEAMMKIHQYTMLCAPILSQEAAMEALRRPADDITDMKEAYRRHRNYIHAALTDMGLQLHKPRGAFYAFPYVGHLGLRSKEFALRLLEEERVACVPGTAFGPHGEGYVRCSYATGLNDLKVAMDRMGRFVARLSG